MAIIHFIFFFVTGHADFFGIDNDNIIAGIDTAAASTLSGPARRASLPTRLALLDTSSRTIVDCAGIVVNW